MTNLTEATVTITTPNGGTRTIPLKELPSNHMAGLMLSDRNRPIAENEAARALTVIPFILGIEKACKGIPPENLYDRDTLIKHTDNYAMIMWKCARAGAAYLFSLPRIQQKREHNLDECAAINHQNIGLDPTLRQTPGMDSIECPKMRELGLRDTAAWQRREEIKGDLSKLADKKKEFLRLYILARGVAEVTGESTGFSSECMTRLGRTLLAMDAQAADCDRANEISYYPGAEMSPPPPANQCQPRKTEQAAS